MTFQRLDVFWRMWDTRSNEQMLLPSKSSSLPRQHRQRALMFRSLLLPRSNHWSFLPKARRVLLVWHAPLPFHITLCCTSSTSAKHFLPSPSSFTRQRWPSSTVRSWCFTLPYGQKVPFPYWSNSLVLSAPSTLVRGLLLFTIWAFSFVKLLHIAKKNYFNPFVIYLMLIF